MKISIHTKPIFQIALLLIISGSSLYALPIGENENPGQRRGHRDGEKKLKMLLKADLNQDGVISFEEFSVMARLAPLDDTKKRNLYDFLDRNNDGKLQPIEVRPKEPHWVSLVKRDFSQFDKNNSADISFEEFIQIGTFADRKPERMRHLFNDIDQNEDKGLTLKEITDHRGGGFKKKIDFTKFDLNESGGLDKAEYLQLPMINKMPKDHVEGLFLNIDENEDGELSSEEFKSHQAKRGHRKPLQRR